MIITYDVPEPVKNNKVILHTRTHEYKAEFRIIEVSKSKDSIVIATDTSFDEVTTAYASVVAGKWKITETQPEKLYVNSVFINLAGHHFTFK